MVACECRVEDSAACKYVDVFGTTRDEFWVCILFDMLYCIYLPLLWAVDVSSLKAALSDDTGPSRLLTRAFVCIMRGRGITGSDKKTVNFPRGLVLWGYICHPLY